MFRLLGGNFCDSYYLFLFITDSLMGEIKTSVFSCSHRIYFLYPDFIFEIYLLSIIDIVSCLCVIDIVQAMHAGQKRLKADRIFILSFERFYVKRTSPVWM